jgi:superfamily II DNA/RNA helicase
VAKTGARAIAFRRIVDLCSTGCQIVCGTLGKLESEISKNPRKRSFDPSQIKYFVIDEADDLLKKQNSYNDILKILKSARGRCPACGRANPRTHPHGRPACLGPYPTMSK